jgi:D-alanyl-D-alanine carboxypeptidase/D-alanyl-D-alanine-endopeptidase (penicillin-binding protein 4)
MKTIGFFVLIIITWSCGHTKLIANSAEKNIYSNEAFRAAHVGISIFEPATNKYWYSFQDDKYFVPASNVKIATTYAALKYLGNRLKGLQYEEHDNTIIIEGTGDPTLLHPDFKDQPVLEFLKNKKHILINTENWADEKWGRGWSWDDYASGYMAERSALPVYGNRVTLTKTSNPAGGMMINAYPSFFRDSLIYEDNPGSDSVSVERTPGNNQFHIRISSGVFTSKNIPFATYGFETTRRLLRDTLKTDIRASHYPMRQPAIVRSYPLDSVLKPMMHQSDNFLAEQTLLMASNEVLGLMNVDKLIDTLMRTDLNTFPQKPRWVDGSGLSRYNLFTPRDFIYLLNKIRSEFGMDRAKEIFPTGKEGTLRNYYGADSSFIYAKTGSLSGVVSLSGYLYTKKNKLLLFSVLINNHAPSAEGIRKAMETFLLSVRNRY